MVHPTNHDHGSQATSTSCNQISGHREEYVKHHIDNVKQECQEYGECVDAMLSSQSALDVLSGKNIELKTICDILEGSNEQMVLNVSSSGCTVQARETIRKDIQDHLHETLTHSHAHNEADVDADDWRDVRKCLRKADSELEEFSKVCLLTQNSSQVCSLRTHRTLESFYNHQLEHLQCVCRSLPVGSSNLPAIIGGAVGGIFAVLVIIIIILLIVICRNRRKRLHEKKMRNTSICLANWDQIVDPRSEAVESVYSDIDEQAVSGVRGGLSAALITKGPPEVPPELPSRYTRDPTNGIPTGPDGYLEPVSTKQPLLEKDSSGSDLEHSVPPSGAMPVLSNTEKPVTVASEGADKSSGYETLAETKTPPNTDQVSDNVNKVSTNRPESGQYITVLPDSPQENTSKSETDPVYFILDPEAKNK